MSGFVDSLIALAKAIWPAATKVATLDGTTVTAGELENAAGTLTGFLSDMQAAIKAKNYGEEAELTVDEALTIAKDAGIGGPGVAIAAAILPILFGAINSGQIPAGSLSDNAGEQQEQDVQSSVGL